MKAEKIDNTPKWAIVVIYLLTSIGIAMMVAGWFITPIILFCVIAGGGVVCFLTGIALTAFYAGEYILDNKQALNEEEKGK